MHELSQYKANETEMKLIVENQYEDTDFVFARETGKSIFPCI